jgi:cell wall-associated NlpC family hydrolase
MARTYRDLLFMTLGMDPKQMIASPLFPSPYASLLPQMGADLTRAITGLSVFGFPEAPPPQSEGSTKSYVPSLSPRPDFASQFRELAEQARKKSEEHLNKALELAQTSPKRRKLEMAELAMMALPALFGGSGGAAFASGMAQGFIADDMRRMEEERRKNQMLSQFFMGKAQTEEQRAFGLEQAAIADQMRAWEERRQLEIADRNWERNSIVNMVQQKQNLGFRMAEISPELAAEQLRQADELAVAAGMPWMVMGDVLPYLQAVHDAKQAALRQTTFDGIGKILRDFADDLRYMKSPEQLQTYLHLRLEELQTLPGMDADLYAAVASKFQQAAAGYISALTDQAELKLRNALGAAVTSLLTNLTEFADPTARKNAADSRLMVPFNNYLDFIRRTYIAPIDSQIKTLEKQRDAAQSDAEKKELDIRIAELKKMRLQYTGHIEALERWRKELVELAGNPTWQEVIAKGHLSARLQEIQANISAANKAFLGTLITSGAPMLRKYWSVYAAYTALSKRLEENPTMESRELQSLLAQFEVDVNYVSTVYGQVVDIEKVSAQEMKDILLRVLVAVRQSLTDAWMPMLNGAMTGLGENPFPPLDVGPQPAGSGTGGNAGGQTQQQPPSGVSPAGSGGQVQRGGTPRGFRERPVAYTPEQEALADFEMRSLGTPRKEGGRTVGPNGGVDCSGFVECAINATSDVKVSGLTTASMYNGTNKTFTSLYGDLGQMNPANLQPGDIIVFRRPPVNGRQTGHAGIVSADGQHVLHASSKAGKVVKTPVSKFFANSVKSYSYKVFRRKSSGVRRSGVRT